MIKVNRVEKIFQGNEDFFESIEYDERVPYYILQKDIVRDEIVPIHYAPTIEILLCHNLDGYITMGHSNIHLTGDCVFLFPPGVVHGTNFYAGIGKKICLTISPDALRHYINLENILLANSLFVDYLQSSYDCFPEVYQQVQRMIEQDGNFMACLSALLQIFEILLRNLNQNQTVSDLNIIKNAQFQKLIDWSKQNIGRKIDLDEAALVLGYSKSYFCKYFKTITGMTYINFLQKLRVAQAELILRQGGTVSDCSSACGYENDSYFIQLFQKHTGKTMLRYKQESQKSIILED